MAIVNKQVVEYINKSIAQGYDEEGIRASLQAYGYPQHEIEAAFQYIKKTKSIPSFWRIVNKKWLLLGASTILIVALAIILLFTVFKEPTITVDRPDTSAPVIIAPEPVETKETVTPEQPKEVIVAGEDIIETLIPDVSEEEREAFNAIPGNSLQDKFDYVVSLAKTNPRIASSKCEDFLEYKNDCYTNLAVKQKTSNICKLINDERLIDACLLKLAFKNVNTCTEVQDKNMKSACETLFTNIPSIVHSSPNLEYPLPPASDLNCSNINQSYEISICEDALINQELYDT